MKHDIIIIGAGAAGLIAMKELLAAGYRVCLLEAASIAGGRIATVTEEGFSGPVETGAEFVHGKLPLTLALLDEAGIAYTPVAGKMIMIENGSWHPNQQQDPQWEAFMRKLSALNHDVALNDFLEENFSGEAYRGLRDAVQHYANGFDLADTSRASSLAALREWGHAEETQYRLPGGYGQLVDFLLRQCRHDNSFIQYNNKVQTIEYSKNGVVVTTANKQQFEAAAVLITVSVGTLQANAIHFLPALNNYYANAIKQLGFGDVIKVLLQFTTSFWSKMDKNIGFLLSDEKIPTWWTQLPGEQALLTGWVGGPAATALCALTDNEILQHSLQSLSVIFNTTIATLQEQLVHHKVVNWHQHPFAQGGYSYVTTGAAEAKKMLFHPLEGVVHFAGEGMYRGESQGTVEAALQSGQLAAKHIMQSLPVNYER